MNILAEIIRIARKNPRRTAIIDLPNAREFTYAEILEEVEAAAGALMSAGVGEADRVVLMSGNSPEFIFIFLAVLRLNAVCVPLRPGLMPYELEKILNDAKPRLITADSAYLSNASVAGILAKYEVYAIGGFTGNYKGLSSLGKRRRGKLPSLRVGKRKMASISNISGTAVMVSILCFSTVLKTESGIREFENITTAFLSRGTITQAIRANIWAPGSITSILWPAHLLCPLASAFAPS